MSRSLTKQKALARFITEQRKAAGLTQAQVAKKLRRYQSFVANVESGQRRVDVVELVEIARAVGFDPAEALQVVR